MDGSIADEFGTLSRDDWVARAEQDLKGAPLASLRTPLTPGVDLEPLYTAAEGALPASVRGRSGAWVIRQEYDDPRMEVCRDAIREDLARGVEAITLVAGLEHGTRVLTPGDLELVLDGVDLTKVAVHLESEGDALPLGLALVAVAEKRGVSPKELRGGFGADPLGTLARSGNLPSGLAGGLRDLVELAAFARAKPPGVRPLLVSTRAYHDAGASPTEEIAWALSTGVQYLRTLMDAGFLLEEAVPLLEFSISVAPRLFVEVAKLRALRWTWAKVLASAGVGPELARMQLHVRSADATRTRRDPWVNMLRGTAETFIGAVGGADSIACVPFDHTLGPSDGMARRVARNTQLVLREESQLHAVDDPAAGSWTLESLTDAFAREAWSLFQEIEQRGGMARALRTGFVSSALDASRRPREDRIARRLEPVLGVSEFPNLDEEKVERPAVSLQDVEVELGNPFGEATPDQRHEALLAFAQTLRDHGGEPGRVAEAALEATRLGVDVFSLGTLLRTGRPSLHLEPLAPLRPAEPWEELRDATDRWAAKHGRRPRAFAATLGPLAEHNARLTWVRNVLAAGGIETVVVEGVEDVAGATEAMGETEAELAFICGADARYPEAAGELAAGLKAKGARVVLLAGKPKGELAEELPKKGVDGFLFAGDDLLESLRRVLRAVEVLS
ncbi:MAG: methylmalonyl-CoA mutase [Sandaracinus sp.]|nr:methylmalonyl-CoA mutase [Sandaracinus sp.]